MHVVVFEKSRDFMLSFPNQYSTVRWMGLGKEKEAFMLDIIGGQRDVSGWGPHVWTDIESDRCGGVVD